MSNGSEATWVLTTRWILPVDGPALEGGTVTIAGDRIHAVRRRGERSADVDLGNSAVVPGFVNAHTHLDLSGLRGRTPPSSRFTDWLRAVISFRRQRTHGEVFADVRAGLAESLGAGTTLVGDISSAGLSWEVLEQSPGRAVVFYELLGLPRDRARAAWRDANAWLTARPGGRTVRAGLSPHAPYSVRRSLFRAAAMLARRRRLPLTVHLAESRAELELLGHRRGEFVEFLTDLDVWDPAGLAGGADEVLRLTAAAGTVLFAHGNYLSPETVLPAGAGLVYCPRTHAAFGHEPYPLAGLLARGVSVALGTDSLASSPDLSVLAEACFLHERHPEVAAADVLRLATLAGARALGWDDETGSLTPGKSADLAVVPLPADDDADPHRLLLRSGAPARAVLWRGRWVYGPGVAP